MGPCVVQGPWGIPTTWLVGMNDGSCWQVRLGCPTATAGPGALVPSPAQAPLQLSIAHDVCPGGLDSLGDKHRGSSALRHWSGDAQRWQHPACGSPEAELSLQEQPEWVPLTEPTLAAGNLPAGVYGSSPRAVPGAPVSGKVTHCLVGTCPQSQRGCWWAWGGVGLLTWQ